MPALGRLNAKLRSVHYAENPPPEREVSGLVKEARALYLQAALDARTAENQDRLDLDNTRLSRIAAYSRHVAKHTMTPNTMCPGPCVHVPRATVPELLRELTDIHGPNRTDAVKKLSSTLSSITADTPPSAPRLCESTGIPCVAARFDQSNDVRNLVVDSNVRSKLAAQILKEATHTRDFAMQVGASRVRELEADSAYHDRLDLDLSGGGEPRVSTHETVRAFFRQHQLGQAPDTGDIRVALNHVTNVLAPRVKTHVTTDLWSRWMKM